MPTYVIPYIPTYTYTHKYTHPTFKLCSAYLDNANTLYEILGINFTLRRTFWEDLLISCVLFYYAMILLSWKGSAGY